VCCRKMAMLNSVGVVLQEGRSCYSQAADATTVRVPALLMLYGFIRCSKLVLSQAHVPGCHVKAIYVLRQQSRTQEDVAHT
jgi:hypothetical protein